MKISAGKLISMHFIAYSLVLLAMKAIPDSPFVLVISDPRSGAAGAARVIGLADGQLVEGTRFEWMSVAYSPATDFPARLRRSGALMVLDYSNAAGCLQRSL